MLIDYDKDSLVKDFKIIKEQDTKSQLNIQYEYDGLGRPLKEKLKIGKTDFSTKEFTFKSGVDSGTTTALVDKETTSDGDIKYEYDIKGRITKITKGEEVIDYEYDDIGQLIKEANLKTGNTITYAYDNGGNSVNKATTNSDGETTTIPYEYDESWQDCLKTYNGETIEYDSIGNPLTLHDGKLTWTQGRRLASYSKEGTESTYLYDENGIRKSKTVNGVKTEYVTSQGEVIAQKSDGQVIQYLRDYKNQLIAMTVNDENYYYEKNIQGDVMALLDKDGKKVVEYSYDAYGNILSIEGEAKDTLGKTNPFRYRSYFYDEESGFYYLQQRYYDSEIGRFINFDSLLGANQDELAYNIYAYCSIDPVNHVDPTGQFFIDWRSIVRLFFPPINFAIIYNASNAVNYARTNYNVRNTNYPNNTGNADCTNFVSQSMLAGGLKMDNIWWTTGVGSSFAWADADANRRYLRDSRRITPTITTRENMQLDKVLPGDVIYFFNNDHSDDFSHHAAIVTEVTADDVIYTAHSDNKNDGSAKLYFSDEKSTKFETYRP